MGIFSKGHNVFDIIYQISNKKKSCKIIMMCKNTNRYKSIVLIKKIVSFLSSLAHDLLLGFFLSLFIAFILSIVLTVFFPFFFVCSINVVTFTLQDGKKRKKLKERNRFYVTPLHQMRGDVHVFIFI